MWPGQHRLTWVSIWISRCMPLEREWVSSSSQLFSWSARVLLESKSILKKSVEKFKTRTVDLKKMTTHDIQYHTQLWWFINREEEYTELLFVISSQYSTLFKSVSWLNWYTLYNRIIVNHVTLVKQFITEGRKSCHLWTAETALIRSLDYY